MAGRAQEVATQELTGETAALTDAGTRDRVREVAAKLYGQGFERKHIAKMLVDHLVPVMTFEDGTPRPLEQRMSQARTRLRNWEMDQKFRDMIYNLAVVKLDLQTPAILGGVAKKAKRGRVDAARLALELTGRHNPKGDSVPTQIIVAIEGVPRPRRVVTPTEDLVIEADESMVEEDDEV